MKILVIEDEVQLADALCELLKRNMYSADVCYNGIDGLDNALTGVYDCILLDIMLPGMNGIDVLRHIRSEKISTPVLLLTARSEISDKINGLDCGADDYLTKPFVTGELLARVRALTRRKGEIVDENKMEFHGLALHKNTCSISCDGNDVKLSLKEYNVMEMLIANPGQILPKERIIEKIWGSESDVEYNNIEVYISFLRKKIASISADVQIKTARGIGYFIE
ncbi:MAG: response regulator transcription factor [Ruminococcus sp.]|jgi:DNA-binding response OmpR family regulator|nr:response regulator transcription factor [Ruminococcus sp.]MBR3901656.1 response regulator transcription factor [Ruminococcus sp.]